MTSLPLAVLGVFAATALLCLWGRATLALARARVEGVDLVVPTLTGVLALTLVVVAQVAAGRQPSLALTLAALGATVVAAGIARGWDALAIRPAPATTAPEATWTRIAAGVLVAAIVLALASALLVARHAPLAWDAVALWTFKAHALGDAASFRDHYMPRVGPVPQFHQDYPLAVPAVDWWLARLGAGPVPRAASLAGVVWLAALPALAWSGLRERAGMLVAAALGLALVAHPVLRDSGYTGMADLPLAVALLAVVRELARDDAAGRRRAALMIALAAAIKNEGMILVLAALVAQFVDVVRTRDWRRAPIAALPVALMVPWMLVRRGAGVGTRGVGELAGGQEPGELLAIALGERLPVLVDGIVDLARLPSFLPALLLFVAGLATQAVRWRRGAPEPITPWLTVALYCGGLLASYLLLVEEPIGWLVETSLMRLAAATLPALALLGVRGVTAYRVATDPSRTSSVNLSATPPTSAMTV